MVNYLHCPVPDVVHPLYPQHLILCFELLGDTLTLSHLFCQQEHLFLRPLVDVGQIGIQLAAGQKLRVQGFALLLDILQVPLPPNADGPFFFGGQRQAGDIIILTKE